MDDVPPMHGGSEAFKESLFYGAQTGTKRLLNLYKQPYDGWSGAMKVEHRFLHEGSTWALTEVLYNKGCMFVGFQP